jgi:hypothetical protein
MMTSVTAPEIVIGDTRHEHIRIRVLGRTHPGAQDSAEANWLVSPISIAVGGFTAEIPAALRSDELHRFREGLEQVQRSAAGTAVLKSIEAWISLAVVHEANGTLSVTGSADDQPGIGNTLRFAFDGLDAALLEPLVVSLRACEEQFPVVEGP